jgi:hypothetical protein
MHKGFVLGNCPIEHRESDAAVISSVNPGLGS